MKPARYRFRYRTKNAYPSVSGFQVTMPAGYQMTAKEDYKLTCLTGCTTSKAAI